MSAGAVRFCVYKLRRCKKPTESLLVVQANELLHEGGGHRVISHQSGMRVVNCLALSFWYMLIGYPLQLLLLASCAIRMAPFFRRRGGGRHLWGGFGVGSPKGEGDIACVHRPPCPIWDTIVTNRLNPHFSSMMFGNPPLGLIALADVSFRFHRVLRIQPYELMDAVAVQATWNMMAGVDDGF